MALGNIFEDGARDPDGLIFVDKDATVKCHHDDVVELEICGINFGLTMNEARRAVQCLADI